MEEQLPPPPPPLPEEGVSITPPSSLPPPPPGTGVDVTLKRKTVHTNVTVVESATRFWLSAQVMVACIMLALLAVSIRSSRDSIAYFPDTFNSTCTDATYEVKQSIELALIIMLDEAVNITNTEYQNSVTLARTILSKSMNLTVDVFLLLLKNVNPLIYCTIDSGLAVAQTVKQSLRDVQNDIPDFSCPIPFKRDTDSVDPHSPLQNNQQPPQQQQYQSYNATHVMDTRDFDICQEATDALRSLAGSLGSALDKWPSLPGSLTDALDQILFTTGITAHVNNLAHFPAPDIILNINSTEIIRNALANASAFDDIATTCTEVSVKFNSATHKTAKVMYYIEIAIWVAIVVLLLGIFIVAIVRQFPTVVVEWIQGKIEHFTNKWDNKIDNWEKSTVRTWQLYALWTLKYINFKKAALTTAYGILGIILVYNLTNIIDGASKPIEVWVDTSLGPGFDKIQAKLQDGINQVIDSVEVQLNAILQDEILSNLSPANDTFNSILSEKAKILDKFNEIRGDVNSVPVIGPIVSAGVGCMLPLAALNIIDTAIDLLLQFLQEILGAQLSFPRLTFPHLSEIAVTSTHIVVTRSVQVIQDQLLTYEIIFIILSAAFGILVLQGLLFVGLRRIAMRIKKQRRLTRLKSQQKMAGL